MKDRLIYALNEDDAQTVAIEELGRKLSSAELGLLEDEVAKRIDWYEAIAYALSDVIRSN